MRFIDMIRKLRQALSSGREVKAACDKMNETLEIREPVVRPLRKRAEERRRASLPSIPPLDEPVANGSH